jgi:hypothetical protein
LQGFQEIALLKALKSTRGRDHAQIRKEYLAARTKGGEKYFMFKVAMMTMGNRLSAVTERKLGFLSLFRPMPQLAGLPIRSASISALRCSSPPRDQRKTITLPVKRTRDMIDRRRRK